MLYRAAVERQDECGIHPVLLIAEAKAWQDLEAFSSRHGVPVARLDPSNRSAFDDAVTRCSSEARPDLIALTFDRIIPPVLVAAYQHRIINVHPALLPSFAGMNGIARTLASGVLAGGASIHEVTDDVDGGPLIAQAVVPLVPHERAEDYGRRLFALLEPMFLQTLRWFAEDRVHNDGGRIRVDGAQYGSLPVIPSLEYFKPGASCNA